MQHRRQRMMECTDESLAADALSDLVAAEQWKLDSNLESPSRQLLDAVDLRRIEGNVEVTRLFELAVETFFSSHTLDPVDDTDRLVVSETNRPLAVDPPRER